MINKYIFNHLNSLQVIHPLLGCLRYVLSILALLHPSLDAVSIHRVGGYVIV